MDEKDDNDKLEDFMRDKQIEKELDDDKWIDTQEKIEILWKYLPYLNIDTPNKIIDSINYLNTKNNQIKNISNGRYNSFHINDYLVRQIKPIYYARQYYSVYNYTNTATHLLQVIIKYTITDKNIKFPNKRDMSSNDILRFVNADIMLVLVKITPEVELERISMTLLEKARLLKNKTIGDIDMFKFLYDAKENYLFYYKFTEKTSFQIVNPIPFNIKTLLSDIHNLRFMSTILKY